MTSPATWRSMTRWNAVPRSAASSAPPSDWARETMSLTLSLSFFQSSTDSADRGDLDLAKPKAAMADFQPISPSLSSMYPATVVARRYSSSPPSGWAILAQPNFPRANSGRPKNASASDLLTGDPLVDNVSAEERLDIPDCVFHGARVADGLSICAGSDASGLPLRVLQCGLNVVPSEDFTHLGGLVFDVVVDLDVY